MATEIKDRTLKKRWRYDWAPKMNGSCWDLHRGTDFDDLENARQAAINYARRHGITLITTKMNEDTLSIEATAWWEDPEGRRVA